MPSSSSLFNKRLSLSFCLEERLSCFRISSFRGAKGPDLLYPGRSKFE